jgi:hypothetical protein
MGVKFIPLLLIIAVMLFSGCTQTGQIINKTTELPEGSYLQPEFESPEESSNISINLSKPEESEEESETELPETTDSCEGVVCPNSISICDDGYKARCENECKEGICPICIPDCSGHEIECELSCGACEEENEDDCQCDIIVPCDGNGLCEEGEYPDSDDCPDCDDDNECTFDDYNHTLDQCQNEIIFPCCGNTVCEIEANIPENYTNCPEDCNISQEPAPPDESQEPQTYNVTITFIEPQQEWVQLKNNGNAEANMTGWQLSDIANHVYTFPALVLDASSFMIVHTINGTDNSTDVFWNRKSPVWNNDGDNATLRNQSGDILSTYNY